MTEQREQNIEDLEKRVVEEQERVAALIEKVAQSETLIRADTPAKEALDEAAKIKRKFDESVKRLAQYKGYQETLSLAATPIPEVEEFENKFGVRHRLWQIRHQFGDMQKRWYHENFRDQDATQICATVKELSGELTKLKMKYKEADEVLEAVQAEVGAVAKHSALIAALGNKHMQEKHWVKVWQLVDGQPSGTLLNFTFNLLLQQGIDAHFEQCEIISAFAAGEAGILEQVAKIRTLWDETYFAVRPYRDTKDRFFITEIDELVSQLEDN